MSAGIILAGYLWFDFYKNTSMNTLYWIMWFLTASEVSSLLVRSYIVGQTERRIERARWLIRLIMLEWLIVTFSPFYPQTIAKINTFFFGNEEITINVGQYLLTIGISFLLLFIFCFKNISQIYGTTDLSHQPLADVEKNTTAMPGLLFEDESNNTGFNEREAGEIWKGKSKKKATVTAVMEYMLDFKEEEEKKALSRIQREDAQLKNNSENHSLWTSINCITGTSPTNNKGVGSNSSINWKAIAYLIYTLTVCLILHYSFQVSFILFERMIPILFTNNYKINFKIYEWIYIIANSFGLIQYYFLEKIAIYRNISYYFMIIGIFSFILIIWMMIHGETLFIFIYSKTQTYMNNNSIPLNNGNIFAYIQVCILIISMILSYAFSYPLSMMPNLITYSSIPVPSCIIFLGQQTMKPIPSKFKKDYNPEPYEDRDHHSIGFNFTQALYSLVSVLALLTADQIVAWEQIPLEAKLTNLGDFVIPDPTQPKHRRQDGLSVDEEMQLLYYILFFASIHLWLLCVLGKEFEWIFSSTRRQKELINNPNASSKSLSLRHWIGILFAVGNIVYVILMKKF